MLFMYRSGHGKWICKTCEKMLKLLDKVGYPVCAWVLFMYRSGHGKWICKTCEKRLKLLDKVGYPRNHLKLLDKVW